MSSAPSSLSEALRAVLLDPGEATALRVHGRTRAAVLVALYDGATGSLSPAAGDRARATDLHAVFTRRRDDLRSHGGEIAFPGGRQDEGEDLPTTALREAEEEIGLPRAGVTIVGALAPTPTVATSFAVYPFVGLIDAGRRWILSAAEVDEVLELRLADLRAARSQRRLLHRGIPFRSGVYDVGPQTMIWGATARILDDLLARVDGLLGTVGAA